MLGTCFRRAALGVGRPVLVACCCLRAMEAVERNLRAYFSTHACTPVSNKFASVLVPLYEVRLASAPCCTGRGALISLGVRQVWRSEPAGRAGPGARISCSAVLAIPALPRRPPLRRTRRGRCRWCSRSAAPSCPRTAARCACRAASATLATAMMLPQRCARRTRSWASTRPPCTCWAACRASCPSTCCRCVCGAAGVGGGGGGLGGSGLGGGGVGLQYRGCPPACAPLVRRRFRCPPTAAAQQPHSPRAGDAGGGRDPARPALPAQHGRGCFRVLRAAAAVPGGRPRPLHARLGVAGGHAVQVGVCQMPWRCLCDRCYYMCGDGWVGGWVGGILCVGEKDAPVIAPGSALPGLPGMHRVPRASDGPVHGLLYSHLPNPQCTGQLAPQRTQAALLAVPVRARAVPHLGPHRRHPHHGSGARLCARPRL